MYGGRQLAFPIDANNVLVASNREGARFSEEQQSRMKGNWLKIRRKN